MAHLLSDDANVFQGALNENRLFHVDYQLEELVDSHFHQGNV